MSEPDRDRADYEISVRRESPGWPEQPPVVPVPEPDEGNEEDEDLLADLPPMPPLPAGPKPPETVKDPDAVDAPESAGEPPDLEAIYNMTRGIMPEHDQLMESMAAVHARWRKAWRETGEFTDGEAFELVRILVAAAAGGIHSLD